jgi:hypothetical protein
MSINFISQLFDDYIATRVDSICGPDYLVYSVKAMKQLKSVGRTNFLFALAKGLGTLRSCGTDSLFPSKRIIAGLFDYSANFFNSVNVSQVRLNLIMTCNIVLCY